VLAEGNGGMSKFDYVRSEARKPVGGHHCHWPNCDKPVPPAMWGCKQHWSKLPMRLRSRIWATYRPGQEISKTPSAEYVAVAHDVQEWIAAQGTEARRAETPQDGSVHDGPVGLPMRPNTSRPQERSA
jgi:hypothetical protein